MRIEEEGREALQLLLKKIQNSRVVVEAELESLRQSREEEAAEGAGAEDGEWGESLEQAAELAEDQLFGLFLREVTQEDTGEGTGAGSGAGAGAEE